MYLNKLVENHIIALSCDLAFLFALAQCSFLYVNNNKIILFKIMKPNIVFKLIVVFPIMKQLLHLCSHINILYNIFITHLFYSYLCYIHHHRVFHIPIKEAYLIN